MESEYSMAGVSIVPKYVGKPCRVCNGEHAVRHCPELRLPSVKLKGRDLILDGGIFDETSRMILEFYCENWELIAIEVRPKARDEN